MVDEGNPSPQHRNEILIRLIQVLVAGLLLGAFLGGAAFAQDDGDVTEVNTRESSEPARDPSSESPVASSEDEEIHDELRKLRDRLIAAYEKRDMDAMLNEVADDVVITWQNGERNEGHQEFKDFYDRMMNGDSRVVMDVSSTVEVDADSVLYEDDTAVARGTLSDKFSLADGSNFTLDSKWTATVVKQDGQWKVASYHVSANIFDNPMLDTAKAYLGSAALIGSVIGGLAGLALGWILGRMFRRKAA